MSRPTLALRALVCMLAVPLVAAPWTPAAAQSLWMPRDADHTVMLELLRPTWEPVDSDLLSGPLLLSGRTALSPRLAFVGELVYARLSGRNGLEEISSSTIGNPYLGLEARIGEGPIFLEFGGRPPLASDDDEAFPALITGLYTDVSRFNAFAPNAVSIQTAFNVREVTPSKIAYRLRFSPMFWKPTQGGGDSELFAIYSFQIGYHGTKARIGAGMSGNVWITEDFENLGDRSSNQFEVHADFLSGSIRPGLNLHVPLSYTAGLVPAVVGANISWTR
ncbi:MAG: hypothetical protein ACRD1Z_07915 [Vicinamibacteria bacterium]